MYSGEYDVYVVTLSVHSPSHVLEYIDFEGTRLRSEISPTRTASNRLDLVAQLIRLATSRPRTKREQRARAIPKVAGSIPTVVRQTFQLARCGCTLRVTSQIHGTNWRFYAVSRFSMRNVAR